MRLLFHAAVAASSPPWTVARNTLSRGRRTETDLDSGCESLFGGDPPFLPSPPDAWMRGYVHASIHPSASPYAGHLMRVHRDRRDSIVLCDVGTPGLSAPLGDDRQVRFAAC
ncbi:hypothetical protein CORC01_09044 [Colletotrichum orchidophilum]|uniref:Uncharacterized protein n=1 Tax=Colletotrichum orchidophilum TaxID=1209926 RepID=A0A1G4B2T2_9PEZI|nr:uncharacterized protein CORC01_09044 [Colletotrichum orchidophilum]OHE95612.1 hypothetical protein CORC01_09044 [Colletotrichum orchidophilum]